MRLYENTWGVVAVQLPLFSYSDTRLSKIYNLYITNPVLAKQLLRAMWKANGITTSQCLRILVILSKIEKIRFLTKHSITKLGLEITQTLNSPITYIFSFKEWSHYLHYDYGVLVANQIRNYNNSIFGRIEIEYKCVYIGNNTRIEINEGNLSNDYINLKLSEIKKVKSGYYWAFSP